MHCRRVWSEPRQRLEIEHMAVIAARVLAVGRHHHLVRDQLGERPAARHQSLKIFASLDVPMRFWPRSARRRQAHLRLSLEC